MRKTGENRKHIQKENILLYTWIGGRILEDNTRIIPKQWI